MPDSKITIQGGKVLREGGKLNSSSECNCCGLECISAPPYDGCRSVSAECSGSFAICVADSTYPTLDTDPPVLMARVVPGEYEYVLAGVKKFNLVLTRNSTSEASPVLKCYTWNGSVWILSRTLGDNPFTGLGQCYYAEGFMDYIPGGGINYRLWAANPYHFNSITATVTGLSSCGIEFDYCSIVWENGVGRYARITSFNIGGTATLQLSNPQTEEYFPPANTCVYGALYGTVDVEVYETLNKCYNKVDVLSELTLDVLWRVQISHTLAPQKIDVSVILLPYSSDPTDNFAQRFFEGNDNNGQDSLLCAGETIVVTNDLDPDCFDADQQFGFGGTCSVVFPARGT